MMRQNSNPVSNFSVKSSKIYLTFLMGTLVFAFGCAPPQKSMLPAADGGHEILSVHPDYPGPFQTEERHGEEFRVARGKVGRYGGTFYSSSIGEGPKTFNPWVSTDATSGQVGGMLVSGLVDIDAYNGQVVPALAKSVEVKPDNLTYIVTLRKGLVWSDGQPITAHDVEFTWNTIIKNGYGNPSTRDNTLVAGQFPSVRVLDPLTLEFKTPKPFAPFKSRLGAPIAPAHIFEPLIVKGGHDAFDASWGTSDAAGHPEKFISSGMWLLDHYDQSGDRVIFKRNPRYYMIDKAGHPLPYLDRYVISYVRNQNNEELQFEQGKIDAYGVPGKFVERVRKLKSPDFKMVNLGPSNAKTFLVFNLNTRSNSDTKRPLVDPVKSKWFTNTAFRQAIDWTINRDDMVRNILKGVGQPSFAAESPASPFLNKAVAAGHPQDLNKAKALLKQAGFHYDASGQLLDAAGHPVEFTLYTNTGNDDREATGVSIKQDLSQIGIKVNFKPMDFNVLVGKLENGDWEAAIMGLTGGNPAEPHDGANVWKSGSAVHMFNQRNVSGGKTPDLSDRFPWEKELDDLFERGAGTLDFNERKKIYEQYQAVVAEQQPFIYLYAPYSILAVKTRIQNFDPTPLEAFHNMEEIWIQEGKSSPESLRDKL